MSIGGTRIRTLLDAVSLLLFVCGESLSFFLVPHLNIGGFGLLFILGLILMAVRHVIWPRPHLPQLLWRWLATPAGPERAYALTITIATRLAVLAAGLAAVMAFGYQLLPGQPRLARNELLNLPARYDANWYMGIARRGYEWRPELRARQQPVNFFPAYPIATRAAGDLVTVPAKVFNAPGFLENGNTRVLWGGMLVTLLCILAAACRIVGLAWLETGDRQRARWTLAFVMLWPFALFFSSAYTEAMLIMAVAGTVLAWRQRRFGHAACWGMLCGLVRPNGWTVSVALLADLVLRNKEPRSFSRAAAALSPLAGTALYSFYLFTLTGNPLEWVRSQEAWGLTFQPASFFRNPFTNGPDLAMFACVALAAWACGWFLRQREWLYAGLIAA